MRSAFSASPIRKPAVPVMAVNPRTIGMVNKTVIIVGINRRPWGPIGNPGGSAKPGARSPLFPPRSRHGASCYPRLEYLPTLAACRDVGERERIKTPH